MATRRFKIVNRCMFITFILLAFCLTGQAGLADQDTNVSAFVTRFYQQCLNREPDEQGLADWVESLNSSETTGEELAQAFILSQEFIEQNLTDAQFLSVLYQAFFNREPDASGYGAWLSQLSDNISRETVLSGFTSAAEFENLCQSYGITAQDSEEVDVSVNGFITRFYQECLNREPDEQGLATWVDALNSGEESGESLARSFIFSQEFINQNLTNEEFITVLYNAFFGREPDAAGYDSWNSQMSQGADRETVLSSFVSAQEFINLCRTYGITATTQEETQEADGLNLDGTTFSVKEVRNLQDCGVANDTDEFTAYIHQNGSSLEIYDSYGIWASGSLSGNTATVTSSWYEYGGRVNAVYTVTFYDNGQSFSGTGSGTWTDGESSCNPTTTISGTQN